MTTVLSTGPAAEARDPGEGRDPGGAAPAGVRARAEALAAGLPARSQEIEAARTLPPDLVAALSEAGLFQLTLPVALGGPGTAPRTVVETVELLSRADAATGWSMLIANIGAALLGWLEPAAARLILADDPHVVIAGGLAPLGQAEPDGDGYRLRGRWPFGSGCQHATWFIGGFMVMAGGAPRTNQWGMPEMRLAHFRAAQATVVDTWRVAGLAGTGSHDVVAEAVHVPASLTSVPFFGPGQAPDPWCRMTAYNLLMTLMSGFALGVGRRGLDEVRGQLADRSPPDHAAGWLADPAVEVTLLRHETALAAARRHVLETLDELLAELGTGAEVGYPVRARLAASVIHAYDVAREAVSECFRLGGTAAVLDDNPLQRCLRDLVAGCQHVAFSSDSRRRVAAALLGRQTRPVFFGV